VRSSMPRELRHRGTSCICVRCQQAERPSVVPDPQRATAVQQRGQNRAVLGSIGEERASGKPL
jgi:hypothetical protein